MKKEPSILALRRALARAQKTIESLERAVELGNQEHTSYARRHEKLTQELQIEASHRVSENEGLKREAIIALQSTIHLSALVTMYAQLMRRELGDLT